MQFPLEWLIPAGILAVVAVIGLNFYFEKKRREKMVRIAADLGFSFAKKGPGPDEIGLGHLDLFQRGRAPRSKNMITGKFEDVAVAMFDFQYTTGHGKSQTDPTQTPQGRHDPRDLRQRAVLPIEARPSVPRNREDQADVPAAV